MRLADVVLAQGLHVDLDSFFPAAGRISSALKSIGSRKNLSSLLRKRAAIRLKYHVMPPWKS
jgi:hypothetical protein